MNRNPKHIIISGGGTGGHIFPAISIANALKTLQPDLEILFVGASGRMEMEKVPAAGYRIIGLPIMGFQRKLTLKNLKVVFRLFISLAKAQKILRDFEPSVVIGVGGYASGPVLRAASRKGIPTLLQEQNSYAGVTNKLLAQKAAKICVAYQGMDKYFPAEKIILTGNPVRQDLENIDGKKEEALKFFGLVTGKKTLLILGGSLGARTLNESFADHLENLANSNIQVIWQTGSGYYEEVLKRTSAVKNENVKVHAFISRMDLAYAAADLVVSRAGAGTISELCLVTKPAILVPSPNVAEDHQTKNARALADKDAALMVADMDAKDKLTVLAIDTLNDDNLRDRLSLNIADLALHNSARRIAEEIIKLSKV